MLKKILLMTIFALPAISSAEAIHVNPTSLQSLPSQELGQVVLKFMPSIGETVDWYKNANDKNFKWIYKCNLDKLREVLFTINPRRVSNPARVK